MVYWETRKSKNTSLLESTIVSTFAACVVSCLKKQTCNEEVTVGFEPNPSILQSLQQQATK